MITKGLETLRTPSYVIYTSGSTGRPKGVMIPHRAVVNFLGSIRRSPGLTARDTLLAITTLSFDIAVLEIFLPLTVGARVVIADRATAADGSRLAAKLAASGATVLQATPAIWRLLLEAGWAGDPRLKALCGGEALPPGLAGRLRDRVASLWNLYGPTETTVWSAAHPVERGARRVPLGQPIANTRLYVLDAEGRPTAAGVAGELYIGGDGLARGYLNRPELTAERFVPDPFGGVPGGRLYRTGDLACYDADGALEFLGRIDHQVKVNGHRIELGEIEAALGEHPAVKAAVAVARAEAEDGEKRLVAYFVPGRGPAPAADELRGFLQGKLPAYMVPAVFVPLDALPLTPNGKVDRLALPAPGPRRPDLRQTYVAPRSEPERRLQRLWEEVLGVRPAGVRDDFFESGGDSLRAVRLAALIEKELGVDLPLSALHQGATIELLAERLARRPGGESAPCLVPVQPHGSRPPLFLVHGMGGVVLGYKLLARHLEADQPLHAFQARGIDSGEQPFTRVEDMAGHYLREVLAVQPRGPYHLGGYSFGGLVAYEMARQLWAAGRPVALVAIIDQQAPGASGRGRGAPETLMNFVGNLPGWVADYLAGLSARQVLADFCWAGKRIARKSAGLLRRRLGKGVARPTFPEAYGGVNVPEKCRPVWEANFRADAEYRPQAYPGRVTLLRARVQPFFGPHESTLGWGRLAQGGVDVRRVAGKHLNLLKEPQLTSLAAGLTAALEGTAADAGQPALAPLLPSPVA